MPNSARVIFFIVASCNTSPDEQQTNSTGQHSMSFGLIRFCTITNIGRLGLDMQPDDAAAYLAYSLHVYGAPGTTAIV